MNPQKVTEPKSKERIIDEAAERLASILVQYIDEQNMVEVKK
jgi:hypothetical protein